MLEFEVVQNQNKSSKGDNLLNNESMDAVMNDESGANDNEMLVPLTTSTNTTRQLSLIKSKSILSQNA